MRKGLLVVVAALALAAPAQADMALPLGHAGRWITDADGRVVILHGINMVYKRPPYAPDAIGFGDDDAAFLAQEGYDTVRVGVIYKAVEPQPGKYDDAYLERIRQTVATLARHGIVSLLDFHQDLYNERYQGEGWPDWAIRDDGLAAEPKLGFPGNYLAMPALQRAFDNFWDNDDGLQDSYAAAWKHVAQRFRDDPAVLGYDLMNEPWPGSAWQQCANPEGCPVFDAKMLGFIKRTIKAVRTADPDTLAFYEPQVLFNDGADTTLGDTGDAHAAMSFHDYCLAPDPTACDQTDNLVFQHADDHAKKTGDALLLTEFGATGDPNVLTPMADRADRFMVGWQEWHYCGCDDPTTSGPGDTQAIVLDPRKPPEGKNLDPAKLKLLSRPHPEAIAGTPSSFGFDASSRKFTLDYALKRADGKGSFGAADETVIRMPARQYPAGFGVTVRGGRLLSVPGFDPLVVAACEGATRVQVTAQPSGNADAKCGAGQSVPALRVTVSRRRVRTGRTEVLRVRVTSLGRPVAGASVVLAGAHRATGKDGRARVRKRFVRTGRRFVVATRRGFRAGRTAVRVSRRA